MSYFKPASLDFKSSPRYAFTKFLDREAQFKSFAIDVKNDEGEVIGNVTAAIIRKPIRCLYIHGINVPESINNKELRGKGIGRLMERSIREFIDRNKLVGLLINATKYQSENHPSSFTMYERSGWKPLLGLDDNYLFYSSKELSNSDLIKLRAVMGFRKMR